MIILNGGALPTLLRCRDAYSGGRQHLGRLARPRMCARLPETLAAGFVVGADNDRFSSWSTGRFLRQLLLLEVAAFGRQLTWAERAAPLGRFPGTTRPLAAHPGLRFVTVPDVPFDAAGTLQAFWEWAPMMSALPLAFCVQDGANAAGVPWGWPGLRALFMAGGTDYKLGVEMAAVCREGKRRGLWIHAGRVNTWKRVEYLLGLDFVDSIDGTGFDMFRDTHLPWALEAVSGSRPVRMRLL